MPVEIANPCGTQKRRYTLTAPQIGYSKPVMVMAPQYVEPMAVRLKQAAKDARKRKKK